MNFQSLQRVETADTYLDIAFGAAKRKAEEMKAIKSKDKLNKAKDIELERIRIVRRTIVQHLDRVLKSFPSISTLPVFYIEMIKCSLDYPALKKSLGAMNWASKKIESFTDRYIAMMKKARDIESMKSIRYEYYGRISSIVKQIKDELVYLEYSRKEMKRFPAVKTGVRTVAIAGFPNVGKSSLLKALTSSTPEIASYAFTTKNINIGYFTSEIGKIQVVDVPGTFDRDFSLMNNIEMAAYLVQKHLADMIIFLIDPSETCGYALEKQIKLLKMVRREFKKNTIAVIGKSDLRQRKPVKEGLAVLEVSVEENKGIEELRSMIITDLGSMPIEEAEDKPEISSDGDENFRESD